MLDGVLIYGNLVVDMVEILRLNKIEQDGPIMLGISC
jgi:hypothetical protein